MFEITFIGNPFSPTFSHGFLGYEGLPLLLDGSDWQLGLQKGSRDGLGVRRRIRVVAQRLWRNIPGSRVTWYQRNLICREIRDSVFTSVSRRVFRLVWPSVVRFYHQKIFFKLYRLLVSNLLILLFKSIIINVWFIIFNIYLFIRI
jgi:hypothetical protein